MFDVLFYEKRCAAAMKAKLDECLARHKKCQEKSTHPVPNKDEPQEKTISNSKSQDPAPQAPSELPKSRTWADVVSGNQNKARQQQQCHKVGILEILRNLVIFFFLNSNF